VGGLTVSAALRRRRMGEYVQDAVGATCESFVEM
jgi:hypothetical protein